MIKAVLIDDERPALRVLEHLLKDNPLIEISGMFTNPLEAIDKIADINPQIVFLDINMPQMQGIDAASKIFDQCPEADIIFVTAYDQYAIEAFEIHALDYVLKPVVRDRFEKTLQRVMKKNNINNKPSLPSPTKKLTIKCFGRFQIGWCGEEPVKWRSEKTRELFAFLVHHEGRVISKDEIIDQLWPEVEVEKAVHQLHNGIYYIRKTLEQYGIDRSLISIFRSYIMKLGALDLDVQLFREHLQKIKSNPATKDLEAVEALYAGEYFEGADWPWADFERERLSMQYGEVVVSLAHAYMQKKEFNGAVRLLEKAFNRNHYDERITELLLKLYSMTGNKVKAARHFMDYVRILKEELGIRPPESIVRIYASIK